MSAHARSWGANLSCFGRAGIGPEDLVEPLTVAPSLELTTLQNPFPHNIDELIYAQRDAPSQYECNGNSHERLFS